MRNTRQHASRQVVDADEEEEDSFLLEKLPRDIEKLLTARGVPTADFIHGREQFDVLKNLVKYEVELNRMPTKVLTVAKQTSALLKIAANPIRANYVLGISSFPSDALAKQLAIQLFYLAVKAWQTKHRPGRVMPVWHRVFGGFNDVLRDKPIEENPSLLVISNVNEASSSYKLEKVRDILEKYSHVPRIVVMSGLDPITFFSTKLYGPINAGLLVGPANRVKELG